MTINAPAALVWKAIQDPGEHVAWHPFATRIDGEHAPGAGRTCTVHLWRPKGPVVRVMMPVIRRKFHQTQRAILDGLKQHAER